MKHEDVVLMLRMIADTGEATNISLEDLQSLRSYNLIDVAAGQENYKSPACSLTKKGRVMLKSNSKGSAK